MGDEIDAMLGEEENSIDREEARELREKKIKRRTGSPDIGDGPFPELEPAELEPISHEEKRPVEESFIAPALFGKRPANKVKVAPSQSKKKKPGNGEEKKGNPEELDEETKKAVIERIKQILMSRGRGAAAKDELRRLLSGGTPGGFNAAMGEILKKYAHILDTGGGLEPSEKIRPIQPAQQQGRGFVPYAEQGGGKKREGGPYSGTGPDKPRGLYSSSRSSREGMEGEAYRQTKAADVDAEKAFERMTHSSYHGDPHEDKKKGKSPYAHD